MEEILASIRRIISEDDQPAEEAASDADADADAEAEAEPSEEAEAADDVLELTEVAEEEEGQEEAAAEPEDAEPEEPTEEDEELSIDDVLDEVDVPDELELRDEEPSAEEILEPAAAAPTAEEAGLIADQTAVAAGGIFGSLVAAVDRAHGGSTLGDGNRTIEDLVKEVMRPMVKEWLDENLPDLTERLVRREIERLARRAEDD